MNDTPFLKKSVSKKTTTLFSFDISIFYVLKYIYINVKLSAVNDDMDAVSSVIALSSLLI